MQPVFDIITLILQWDMLPFMVAAIALLGIVAVIKRAIY